MKKTNLFLMLMLITGIIACSNDDNVDVEPIENELSFSEKESDYIRLMLVESDGKIHLLDPNTEEINTPEVDPIHDGARLYVSSTGSFVTKTMRQEGKVKFFDVGIVNHVDHGHTHNPRWLSATAEAPMPTHYSHSEGNIIVFNDGDGSVTHAREVAMETPAFQPRIIAPFETVAHHGAATWMRGNKFAVTFKEDNSEPGGLPQLVHILNNSGEKIADGSGVKVSGIHGDASNGNYSAFGSTDGILFATADDEFFLVENIEPLNNASGNWMGTVRGHDNSNKFYGNSRNHGLFMIDPDNKTMSQLLSGKTINGFFFSEAGTHFIVHHSGNKVNVYDANSGSLKVEGNIDVAQDQNARKNLDDLSYYRLMNEESPVISASEQFLYVLSSSRDQIEIRDIKTLESVGQIALPTTVNQMMRVGFQTI
ncbi:MAG: hypothetical protein JJU23_00830 [Cyclobacteriaceae bacterium]|nr:hypothetical protein [Cyclobacteriaceae bacterium]